MANKAVISVGVGGASLAILYFLLIPGVVITGVSDSTIIGPCAGTPSDPCVSYFNISTQAAIYSTTARNLIKNLSLSSTGGDIVKGDIYILNTTTGIWKKAASRFSLKPGNLYQMKVEIIKRNPTMTIKWGLGKIVDPVFLGYNASAFIKYRNAETAKCLNYNCLNDPIQSELCNPTLGNFKVNLSKIIVQSTGTPGVIRGVGSLTDHYSLNRTIVMMSDCNRTILNNASKPVIEHYQCNKANMTSEENVLKNIPLMNSEFIMTPLSCYNVTIPFNAVNVPFKYGMLGWQVNLTDYGFAKHPFFNTNNYTQPFLNTSEINGTAAGYNASVINETLMANWTGYKTNTGNWYNFTFNDSAAQGYEQIKSSTGACANCGYDGVCANGDTQTWSGTNTGRDWWCLNWSQNTGKKLTVLYAELDQDRGDIIPVNFNAFVTNIRPSGASGLFNASEMIYYQGSATSGATSCIPVNLTPSRILAGHMLCINGTSWGGANMRIGEIEVWTANFTLNSQIISTPITMPSSMGSFKIAANQTLNDGIIGYNISCDGTNYVSVNQSGFDKTYVCTSGSTLIYRIVIEANATTNALSPSVDTFDLEMLPSGSATGSWKLSISLNQTRVQANNSFIVNVTAQCLGPGNCTDPVWLDPIKVQG